LLSAKSRQDLDIMNTRAMTRRTSNTIYRLATAVALAISLLGVGAVGAQEAQMQRQYVPRHKPAQQPSVACGDFNYSTLTIGPLDYRITPPDVRELVERRHFNKNVEQLKKGITSSVGGDINYTLSAFPNHPRALRSAAELSRRRGGHREAQLRFSIECYFDRALAFRPDDDQVRILWAKELLKSKQSAAALEQTKAAEGLANGDPGKHYNVALLYFDLGDYEKSMANAKIAYDGGFDLPGLRDKLNKAGKWKE
jgi:hypothetical protein